jgi:Transglutaminase-like superfamily
MTVLTITMSDPVPPGQPLLLAPRLVDAFGFRLADLAVEHGEIIAEITASNSGQRGYLVRPTSEPHRPILRYILEPFDGEPDEWLWTVPDTRYARASDALRDHVAALVAGAHDEHAKLTRIVAHAGEVFWYGHGPGAVMDGQDSVPLLTRPTRGHCLDMHGYCVAACLSAGISAVYLAGFWFKQGMTRAPGMHCWFAARIDGEIVHYDVSHQLKIPTPSIVPGLNPVPGIRFLAAAGKGLRFDTPLGTIRVDHFARLVWRTQDGRDHYPAHELHVEGGAFRHPAEVSANKSVLEPAC